MSTRPARATSDELSLVDPSGPRVQKISKAMQVYMEKASAHAEFLKEKRQEFELGKRHLANIMGWNPETITQENIDEAIAYLLPTMLFDKKSRPMMKPPEEVYPKQKGALFDITGRPFHYLFYTGKPKYYEYLGEIFDRFITLTDIDAKMKAKGIFEVAPNEFFDPSGTDWISQDEFNSITLENISELEYDYLIGALVRLSKLPYSSQVRDFLSRFRKDLPAVSSTDKLAPVTLDEEGRAYTEAEGELIDSEAKSCANHPNCCTIQVFVNTAKLKFGYTIMALVKYPSMELTCLTSISSMIGKSHITISHEY